VSELLQSTLVFGWSWPSIEEWRDFVIVLYGVMGVIAFFSFTLLMLFLIWILRGVRGSVRDLLEDPVKPALEEVRKTAQSVRGTSEFIADQTVHPIIRVVSAARGVRRGISSLAGIRSRRR
jgi:hypothetical protein